MQPLLGQYHAAEQLLVARVAPQWIKCGVYAKCDHDIGILRTGLFQPDEGFVSPIRAQVGKSNHTGVYGLALVEFERNSRRCSEP